MDKWNKVLETLKRTENPGNFRTWFAKTNCLSYQDGKLVIAVPSGFIKDQLSTKLLPIISQAVESIYLEKPTLEFKVDSSRASKNEFPDDVEFELTSTYKPLAFGLNPRYKLENFVVGLSNNLAYAAAQAVIQNPGLSYNPLFLYGGTGVGKTHLMVGVGHALLQKNPSLKIIYSPLEQFTNDLVQGIQTKSMAQFRNKYRSCNLLLIDDVQFLSGRDSTQEEFFHTFNDLQGKNIQIIVTADRPPHEIQKLEPRLASRFQGGMMVDIQLPDFDTRVAILKAKCKEKGDNISESCLTLIAENMPTNGRELEGKLMQIIQTLKLTGKEFNEENVRFLLGKGHTSNGHKIDSKKVLSGINQYFEIKMADLVGPNRKKDLVRSRQIAMYILYQDCKLAYEKIGEMLGGRDHTTIMHGVEKIGKIINKDSELQKTIEEIKQKLVG
ncbi:MAG: chromosomal replication initiator protein DnaA [Candidatus Daviesbacteria bacterium]|nr:chromosomal replication initiator protein DnaA [Candidatus Daviesbacteria bacterium]